MVVTRQEIPAPTSRPFSRGRPRVWAASTFAATLGVLLRRTAATWEPAHAHGAAHPHPHLRRAEAGTPRPARRAMLSLHSAPPSPSRAPGRGGGGGVATPQSRCRGAQPRCCGNGFQANWWPLAPGSGSLAHFPLLPSLRCGLGGRGCPLSGSGSGWRYQARVLSHPQGGSSARRLSSARALFPPGPQPSRYSRAQASSSNCLPASGQAAQRTEPKLGAGSGPGEQTVATKAAPSAGLEARGARTGAC